MERKKIGLPSHLAQLFIWTGGLGILDIKHYIKLSKNRMDSKVIKSHLWKDLML